MRITVAAIGRFARGPQQAFFQEYAKRLKWKLTLHELEIKKNQSPAVRREQECALLLETVAKSDKRIALDERGENLGSEAFAARIAAWQQQGVSHLGFMIGGSDGLDEAARGKADLLLSFGRATWPHLMVRAMLAEQLYRAQTLLDGHPYHRG